jgi:hypothetical protein
MKPQIVSQIVSLSAKNRSIQGRLESVKLEDKKLDQKMSLISQQLTNVSLMLEKMFQVLTDKKMNGIIN